MSGTTFPQSFSRYPLLWLAIWFASGIVLGYFFEVGFVVSLTGAIGFGALCIFWRRAVIPIAFLSLGCLSYQIETASVAENRIKRIYESGRIQSGEPVEIEGVLSGIPEPAYGGMFLVLRAEKLTFKNSEIVVSGNVGLFLPFDPGRESPELVQLDLGYGSRLRIYCRLERDEKFQNPGVASRVALLDQQGIDATAMVKSSLLIEKVGEESVFAPLAWVYDQRRRLISAFRDRFSPPTAGVMIASLLGDQHFLDRNTSDVFRDGGTFHVLVISGLHITFIGGLVLWLVSHFIRRSVMQFLFAVSFLWAYTLAVGAEVPVVRASVMFTVLIFASVIHRGGSQLNALGLCVLLLLVWRPKDLFSASFQLSAVSVASIVACALPLIEKFRAIGSWMPTAEKPFPPNVLKSVRRFCEFLYWDDAMWKIENARHIWSANLYKSANPTWLGTGILRSSIAYVFEGLAVSLIVQIWMLPLLVVYFHRISPVSVLLNLWVGVFLALGSFCALFAVLIGGVSEWLAAPLIALTELLNTLMIWLPGHFSIHRLAGFRLPVYTGWLKLVYFLYGFAVVIMAALMFRWRPFELTLQGKISRWPIVISLVVTIGLGFTITFHPFSAPQPDGQLKIDFLDVGQGDSALVTFPDGQTMLVDAGGQANYRDDDNDFEPDRRRIGESVVSEFLWEKGYSRVDYLVATHADADHIQGLSDVAENFEVGLVLLGTARTDDPDFSELMRIVEAREIAVTAVRRGDDLSIGGTTIRILNPVDELSERTSTNNSSIVMKISYGSRTFLLTGDIERDAETELLRDPSCDLRADTIKVSHHGSRTSSTEAFVDQVAASTAIISVGRRSRYGHPHAEVVARWRNSGAQIITTGEKGTITITTDRNNVWMSTFVP